MLHKYLPSLHRHLRPPVLPSPVTPLSQPSDHREPTSNRTRRIACKWASLVFAAWERDELTPLRSAEDNHTPPNHYRLTPPPDVVIYDTASGGVSRQTPELVVSREPLAPRSPNLYNNGDAPIETPGKPQNGCLIVC